ncbi:MAG TPA: hypothetical protein VFK06_08390 [Candidatus Angelobacter sp.]|nr:hypothetical protein [Candidatus Angelobacter sp.]
MQNQYRFNKYLRFAVCTVMACGLMPLVGCVVDGGSVSTSVSQNTQTGATTVTVTGTITIKRQPLQQLAMWMPPVSGTDLASLNPSQAIMSYSLSNAAIVSTGGAVTITLTDDNTGATVGQQTFQYVVSNNSLFAQDPTAVSTWLSQFSSYTNLDVSVVAKTDMQAAGSGTVTVTNNAIYQGTSYASASTSWVASPIRPGGCIGGRCPLQ